MSNWVIVGHACAVDDNGVLHGIKTPTKERTAACGQTVSLLGFAVHNKPDDRMTVRWPPYVADAKEWGYTRCRACMKAAPGKPERPPFVKVDAS